MQVFEPELVSFLYVKLLRNEYSFLQIRREVEALKRSIDNLVAVTALPKDKSADDDSQEFAGEYFDSKPFAGIGETASSELELGTEEPIKEITENLLMNLFRILKQLQRMKRMWSLLYKWIVMATLLELS